MSLYQVQKLMFDLNRDRTLRARFIESKMDITLQYKLTLEEREALLTPDIGKLYIMGVSKALLLYYTAILGLPRAKFVEGVTEGVTRYGPIRVNNPLELKE
jgi:hypothetical protein